MAKAKTASFVLELELSMNSHEKAILKKKLNIGRQIYNACLGEALKRLHKVQADKEYQLVLREEKSKGRTQRLKEIERFHGYSEYQLHEWAAQCKAHFSNRLGINEVQKLATRAYKAVEKLHYHKADKVVFKGRNELISIENKTNNTGLRWKGGAVIWSELALCVRIKKNDLYAAEALDRRTKYIRIVPKVIRGKERFFVQFVQEGLPPAKPGRQVGASDERVGIDPGTSTMAIVSRLHVELAELAPNIKADEKKLRRIQRAMDRSRRATNPDKFEANGKVKKGTKCWNYSNRYRKLAARRKEWHRKIRVKRKQAHEQLANQVIALGLDVRTEEMQYKGLQKRAKQTTRNKRNGKINKKKRFGKSLGNRAPAMLLSIVDRKLHYYGLSLKKIETRAVKASQFNHVTGRCTKKELGDRWNLIDGRRVQRDLYSAFLIANTNDHLDQVDVNQASQWFGLFLEYHDEEIKRIKQHGSKTLKWFVA